ncbi:MAG: hypothetical protein AABX03_01220, partial [Nanoarchaeota archaeon]
MVFVGNFLVDSSKEGVPPVKAYLHRSQVETYGSDPLRESRKYLEECLSVGNDKQKESDVILAAIWAEDGKKIIDFAGLKGVKDDWKANPEISAWKFENGIYVRTPEKIWCGDANIIFGREEEMRRRTENLHEY